MEMILFYLTAILFIGSGKCTWSPANNIRMTGGTVIGINEAPSQVSIHITSAHITNRYGGSIVHKRFILTAGHIFKGRKFVAIRARSPYINRQGEVYYSEAIFIHPNYTQGLHRFNAALIRVSKDIYMDKVNSNAATLPRSSYELSEYINVVVTGWGKTEDGQMSDPLRRLFLEPLTAQHCAEEFGIRRETGTFCYISQIMSQKTCAHDDGGPVMQNGLQIGIISEPAPCSERLGVGIAVFITEIRDWIFIRTDVP